MNKREQKAIETAADNCEVLRARLARYEDADGNALANAVGEIPELRQVVTDALMGMISAVTSLTPPANEPPPPFIQAAIDRAVDRIARLNSSPVSSAPTHGDQVREGWQLVPVEPTDAMLEAGDKYIGTPATYKSMLSACPSPAITKDFSQFLSAVMDAAGLIRHGRQSKELSEYLGMKCMEYRGTERAAPSHSEQVREVPGVQITGHLDEVDAPVWEFINAEARKLGPITGSIDSYGLSRQNGGQPNGGVVVLWNGPKIHAVALAVRDAMNRTVCIRLLAVAPSAGSQKEQGE